MNIKHSLLNGLVALTATGKQSAKFVNENGVDIAKDAFATTKRIASDISLAADNHIQLKAIEKRNKATAEFYSKYGADIAHARAGSPQPSQHADECNNMIDPNAHDHS